MNTRYISYFVREQRPLLLIDALPNRCIFKCATVRHTRKEVMEPPITRVISVFNTVAHTLYLAGDQIIEAIS